ncbi:MAG: ArsR family transcriptional regulator [Candidatus Doudnabacteria bacterium]|nr:ArsR family transcriptional regulator [Candidatus Doudnabacteria bacterium]
MINQLKNIGLTENEAKVYVAMLELGPAPVAEIAKKAGINRPTAYFQLESLKKLGLVSTQNKSGKELAVAESPDQLEILMDKESKLLEQKKSELSGILPGLQTMFSLGDDKPVVRYFEGRDGVLTMQDVFIKSKPKEVLSIVNADAVIDLIPTHPETHTPRRVKLKIKSKMIYTSKKGHFLKSDPKLLRETKHVNPKALPFDCDVAIYGNNVSITAFKGKLSGVIITHEQVANSFRALFHLLWQTVK